jgi:hypothetical protein
VLVRPQVDWVRQSSVAHVPHAEAYLEDRVLSSWEGKAAPDMSLDLAVVRKSRDHAVVGRLVVSGWAFAERYRLQSPHVLGWLDTVRLNEGFASWTENFALDHLFPDWSMWEQFTIDAQSAALNLDSLRTSHPIQVRV